MGQDVQVQLIQVLIFTPCIARFLDSAQTGPNTTLIDIASGLYAVPHPRMPIPLIPTTTRNPMLSAHPFWSLDVPRPRRPAPAHPCPGSQQVPMVHALAQLQLAGAGGVLTLMTVEEPGLCGPLSRAAGAGQRHELVPSAHCG